MSRKTPQITDYNLTGREKDILSILWNSDNGLIASEIVRIGDGNLTINTVQAVLKKLLKRELIQIDQIVYSGTVLSRSYIPTFTEEEFTLNMISNQILDLKKFDISPCKFIKHFLDNNIESLSEEEAILLTSIINKKTQ